VPPLSVIVLLADGARPDILRAAIDAGQLPAMAALRHEGGLHTVTSCFPSVTGPAYTPFIMGRFPGPVGLPGLRWFDRRRETCTFPDYTRSYVGYQMGRVDADLDPAAPTIFELAGGGLGVLNVIGRGLPDASRLGRITPRSAARAARTHFGGNVAGWLDIDREATAILRQRIMADRPPFVFAALTGIDKTSHAAGHDSALARQGYAIVDQAVAEIRRDLEQAGRWGDTQLWVTSDHGHSPVAQHEDLAAVVADMGYRIIAHPWIVAIAPEVAVMVSGNAMAHLYVDLARRQRPLWPRMDARWRDLADALLDRPSVDLMVLPTADGALVRHAARGEARVTLRDGRYTYRWTTGDPLGLGAELDSVGADEAHEATLPTDYPDAVVQVAHIALAPRSSEIILSASRGWDFRSRYEPIPHVSSHGALHREHMLVPLLVNQRPAGHPRRTTDVMPSALRALGLAVPPGLDGQSFLQERRG
jgi:hypothetical protein